MARRLCLLFAVAAVLFAGPSYRLKLASRPRQPPAPMSGSPLQPRRSGPDADPVMKRLKSVNCKAEPGYGVNGHTKIRIIMYAWKRNRGYLANRVAFLKRQGCDIRTDANGERVVNFYSHHTVMMLTGTYGGESVRTVWTGSENWSKISFVDDELILHMTGAKIYARYFEHFTLLWNHHTHR